MDAACFFALQERCEYSRMLQELGPANLLCAYMNAHLPEGEEAKNPSDFMIHKPPGPPPVEVPEGLPDPEEALAIFRARQSQKLLKYKAQAQALGEPIN